MMFVSTFFPVTVPHADAEALADQSTNSSSTVTVTKNTVSESVDC